jgi:hypothetical protein
MVDAFRYGGRAVGVQLATALKTAYGWGPVFCVNLAFILFNFFYIFFLVNEKPKEEQTAAG